MTCSGPRRRTCAKYSTRCCAPRTPSRPRTSRFRRPNGEKRSYKMVIANLCHVESIRGVTLNIRDVSDATRLNDQLRTLAFHDSLTLLANRSLFSDRVHQAIRHIADGMTPAVLFIDLDNFKTVNDSLGHSAGDQLLRGFAHRLVQCTRAGDTVARLGGDEFAVLIDHAPDVEAAMAVARQVIDACRQPFEIDGQQVRIGCERRRGARGSRQQCRAAAAQRRRGDVRGEVARQGPRRSVRSPRCCAPRAAACASKTNWPPPSRTAARGALPAHRRPDFAPPRGRRGADALAASDARPGDARRFHPARRGDRPDRADDAVDAESRLRGPGAPAARRSRTARACAFRSTSRAAISTTATSSTTCARRSPRTSVAPDCLILEVTESLLLENSARLERPSRSSR